MDELAVACPTCRAAAGSPCWSELLGRALGQGVFHAARTIRLQVTNRERRVIR